MKKKLFIGLALILSACLPLVAQESVGYALIDMQYLMGHIPAYKSANDRIMQDTKVWNEEIKKLNDDARKLFDQYQKSKSSLSEEEQAKLENAIVKVEDEAQELQKRYFSPTGELAKLQESLLKPIQEQIYAAVKMISEERGYLIVFDRASSVGSIIYADPMADISNDVLAVLGIKEKED